MNNIIQTLTTGEKFYLTMILIVKGERHFFPMTQEGLEAAKVMWKKHCGKFAIRAHKEFDWMYAAQKEWGLQNNTSIFMLSLKDLAHDQKIWIRDLYLS